MPFFAHLRRTLRSAPALCALVAVAVRLAVLAQGWKANPLVGRPALDGFVYLTWAKDIAAGDLLGRSGFIDGNPFFFNPLYAYLIAPYFAGVKLAGGAAHIELMQLEQSLPVLAPRILAVLVSQAFLGGATAALSAAAAQRYFGRAAGYVAGFAVALSHVLVHLDQHVAVSGLAAFLVAGAVYACAPEREGEAPPASWWRGRRGPLAQGLWLGLGALARPVAMFALPVVALVARFRSPARWRASALIVLSFFALAVPTCARNRLVAGETFLYTAVGSVNGHLGNNAVARRYHSMASDQFAFDPIRMHETARVHVARTSGNPAPTWGQVNDHFRDAALHELSAHPRETIAFCIDKARWFMSPVEVPSSASLRNDEMFQPLLRLAFVPTWLLAVLGLLGAALHVRRLEVLQGPVSLVAAHLLVLTAVFPLSHYRSPAVPALAVLSAGAITWCVDRWRAGQRGRALLAVAAAAVLALAGMAPPQPNELVPASEHTLALAYRSLGASATDPEVRRERFEQARAHAQSSLDAQREVTGRPNFAGAWFVMGEISFRSGDFARAERELFQGLQYEPRNWEMRLMRSCALQRLGRDQDSMYEARLVLDNEGDRPDVRGHAEQRIGEIVNRTGGCTPR